MLHGKRTVVQIGRVLQYEREVHCGVSLSSSLRSQEGTSYRTATQMGGCTAVQSTAYL